MKRVACKECVLIKTCQELEVSRGEAAQTAGQLAMNLEVSRPDCEGFNESKYRHSMYSIVGMQNVSDAFWHGLGRAPKELDGSKLSEQACANAFVQTEEYRRLRTALPAELFDPFKS